MALDIQANREARKWSRREVTGRILWNLVDPLFVCSPRPLWAWRRFLLRRFGAKIGRNVQVVSTARITNPWNVSLGDESCVGDRAIVYALGRIDIGRQVTISQGAHLCAGTHDYRRPDMLLLKLPISIADGAWVCADAFVGPNVRIGSGAIVGARAVVVKDVPAEAIVAGNPARPVGKRPSGRAAQAGGLGQDSSNPPQALQ